MAIAPETQIEQSLSSLFRLVARLPEKERKSLLRQVKKIKTSFRILAEEKETLQKNACIDLLTRVPNRRGIAMDFHGRIENMKRHGDSDLILCLIDLDGFKAVNDKCGHHKGDDALREVCARLQKAFRQSDTVGRYGGDEIILFLSYDHDGEENFDVDFVRRTVRNALRGLVYWSGNEPFPIGASIGFACLPAQDVHRDIDTDSKFESLLMQADAAMYADKESGKEERLSAARQEAHAAGKSGKAEFLTL